MCSTGGLGGLLGLDHGAGDHPSVGIDGGADAERGHAIHNQGRMLLQAATSGRGQSQDWLTGAMMR
jgi:hypothetical protein